MRIRHRSAALTDLQSIHEYIARDDPRAAARVIAHVRQSIERLSAFPRSGRIGAVAETYELVVSRYPYIVVYQITDNVEIVGVFHAARDQNNLPY